MEICTAQTPSAVLSVAAELVLQLLKETVLILTNVFSTQHAPIMPYASTLKEASHVSKDVRFIHKISCTRI